MKRQGIILLYAVWGMSAAHADKTPPGDIREPAGEHWTFKLTPSSYVTSHEPDATDLNLRGNYGPHALWGGYYKRGSEFEQSRAGYEYTAQFSWGQVVPSLQLATHGFVGGSLNAQLGGDIFGILGFGRTNARDYYNLNFDPNDSVAYGLGTRLLPRSSLSAFTVKDNRLHTGQMITHMVWRFLPDEQQRWTFDLSTKHGRATEDATPVSGKGLAAVYDYGNLFVRLARDRKVNFSNDDQTRISLGMRF